MAKKTSGRWDHLLREIPAPLTSPPATVTSASAPLTPPSPVKKTVSASDLGENQELAWSSDPEVSPSQGPAVLSVSDINRAIKAQLEGEFPQIWVQGEISNFKAHGSGHFYFSLKDDKSQINCVMFKAYNQKLRFQPDSGLEVVVRGRISVFEPRGNYQIFCESMEPVGAGALQKAFEQLKAKLQSEGLFESSRKKPLPRHPQRLAVVTSPTGAAIQDILNVLRRRSPRLAITVIPARVQGEGAAREIVRGIEMANRLGDFDVMIVGRGGGSLEDLWPFNEEIVARAIASSQVPIISAVGHEVDFTIADFVADHRAPTPSAAAEIVAQSEQEIVERLGFYGKTLRILVNQLLAGHAQGLQSLRKRLVDPRRALMDQMQRLDDVSDRLHQSMGRLLQKKSMLLQMYRRALPDPNVKVSHAQSLLKGLELRLLRSGRDIPAPRRRAVESVQSLLDSLSPLRVVDRGYAIIRQKQRVIAEVKDLDPHQTIQIQLRDGQVNVEIKN